MTGADLIALIKKHPVGTGALLVCLVCGALIYFRGEEIARREQLGEEKAQEAAKVLANVSHSVNLAEQTETLQAATKEIESRLVRPTQIALNLQYFYKMESDTGVKILDVRQNYNPNARAPGRGSATAYVPVPYNVSVQGTFGQTLLFLKKIEAGRHITRFTLISYTKAGGSDVGDAQDQMTLSINLELLGQP